MARYGHNPCKPLDLFTLSAHSRKFEHVQNHAIHATGETVVVVRLLSVLCRAVLVVAPAGVGGQRMHQVGMSDSSLEHITRREYVLNCNWKVFADNYLDGGYHVST